MVLHNLPQDAPATDSPGPDFPVPADEMHGLTQEENAPHVARRAPDEEEQSQVTTDALMRRALQPALASNDPSPEVQSLKAQLRERDLLIQSQKAEHKQCLRKQKAEYVQRLKRQAAENEERLVSLVRECNRSLLAQQKESDLAAAECDRVYKEAQEPREAVEAEIRDTLNKIKNVKRAMERSRDADSSVKKWFAGGSSMAIVGTGLMVCGNMHGSSNATMDGATLVVGARAVSATGVLAAIVGVGALIYGLTYWCPEWRQHDTQVPAEIVA